MSRSSIPPHLRDVPAHWRVVRPREGAAYQADMPAHVARGSLLLSFDKVPQHDCAIHSAAHGESLTIICARNGVRASLSAQGACLDLPGCFAPFDATLSWDVLEGWLRFAVWSRAHPGKGPIWRETRLTEALPGALLARLADPGNRMTDSMAGLAVSTRLLPIGLRGGLAPTVKLASPRGPVDAGRLVPGQLLLTADHDLAQVRWVHYDHHPVWSAAPSIRLRAPYLGLTDDVIVDGDQLIGLTGPDVEYLCGQPEISFRAGDLLGQQGTLAWRPPMMLRLVRIVLDRPAALLASGLPVYAQDPWLGGQSALTSRLGALHHMPAALWPAPAPGPDPMSREELLSLLRFRAA